MKSHFTANDQSVQMSLDEIRLYPGAEIYIQLMAEGAYPRHKVNFIGYIKHKSLLLTLPFEHDQGLWMKAGQTFVIRGFNGLYAYAFSAQVLRARAHPFPYIHFSWPHDVVCQQVRKSRRVAVEMPANVEREGHGAVAVTMLDLSVLGAMLESTRGLGEVGTPANISFTVMVEESEKKLNLSIIIRNIHQKDNVPGFRIGVGFENLTEEEIMILHYFVNHSVLAANI